MKLLEVEGARAPVPHSWRRHCWSVKVYTGSDKSVTRIQCALGRRQNAVSTSNKKLSVPTATQRAGHFPHSRSAYSCIISCRKSRDNVGCHCDVTLSAEIVTCRRDIVDRHDVSCGAASWSRRTRSYLTHVRIRVTIWVCEILCENARFIG